MKIQPSSEDLNMFYLTNVRCYCFAHLCTLYGYVILVSWSFSNVLYTLILADVVNNDSLQFRSPHAMNFQFRNRSTCSALFVNDQVFTAYHESAQ